MTIEHHPTNAYPPASGREGELDTTRARQGEAPGHVRYVLAIGTFLVVAAFAVIYFVGV